MVGRKVVFFFHFSLRFRGEITRVLMWCVHGAVVMITPGHSGQTLGLSFFTDGFSWGGDTRGSAVNLFVRSFEKIDDVKMEFSVQITFRQQWNDNR